MTDPRRRNVGIETRTSASIYLVIGVSIDRPAAAKI